jgi:hypothetical protein
MDSRAHAKVTYTLDIEAGSLFLSRDAILPILYWHLCKSNANRTNVTTEHVTTIQSLARPDSVI